MNLHKEINNAKMGLLNIQNINDEKNFTWSVLATLHSVVCTLHPNRFAKDFQYANALNVDGIINTVSLKSIDRFEKQNPTIFNTCGYDDKKCSLFILLKKELHINPPFLSESNEKINSTLIKTLSRLDV